MYIGNIFIGRTSLKTNSRCGTIFTKIDANHFSNCQHNGAVKRSYNTQSMDVSKQRNLMDSVATKLNIQNMNSWYNVSQKDIMENGGKEILDNYQWSSPLLFSTIYPEHEWLPWKFSSITARFWDSPDNQTMFMNWAAKQLHINDMNDWYKITAKEFCDIGGRGLLFKFNHSMYNLVNKVYPNFDWKPWRFSVCPPNYWDNVNNQNKYMEWVKKELNIKDTSDWYSVTLRKWNELGGSSLLSAKYNDNLLLLLSHFYPDYEWLPWKFEICPRGYWDDVDNQRKFINWAAKELNIKELSDWYNVSNKTISNLGGSGLLSRYRDSMSLLLSQFYPSLERLPWLHSKCPRNYWEDIENQRKYVKWAEVRLGIKDKSDWYSIRAKAISDVGGWGLLSKYNQSPFHLLSAVYPDYEWLPWKFENSPRNMWSNDDIKRKFIEWAGKELGVKELGDWHRVATKDIIDLGGLRLLITTSNSLPQLLASLYPDFPWEFDTKSKSPFHKKSQHLMKAMLKQIFPQNDVLEEYKHPKAIGRSGKRLELDLFYPQLNIAFEYQGKQHYGKVEFFHNYATSLEDAQNRDISKTEFCKNLGITLIEVPYWWDRKAQSLAATIYNSRPDLFTSKPKGEPIPKEEPKIQKQERSENITKKVLMTATEWNKDNMNPKGWYMTEKYDGMRLYWNGKDFYTRHGTKIKVPHFISNSLPSVALDGELWTQYGLYQEAVSLCLSSDDAKWKKAVFWVFDAPDQIDVPFEERLDYIKKLKEEKQLPDFVKIIEAVKCRDENHLKDYFDNIIAKGGEGIMFREPHSMYKAGRSESLRKYKPYFDTEVQVIENNYPHGLQCKQLNGKTLFVTVTENFDEAKKVKSGDVITVKYLGTNIHGTLQYPKFYRERTDIKWDDLIKT